MRRSMAVQWVEVHVSLRVRGQLGAYRSENRRGCSPHMHHALCSGITDCIKRKTHLEQLPSGFGGDSRSRTDDPLLAKQML